MGRKAKTRAFKKGIRVTDLRPGVHPEVCEALDRQLMIDQLWFNDHPGELCHFRPATPFEESGAHAHGKHMAYLCYPDEAPMEAQTWVALIDLPRLYGYSPTRSCRAKFRCLPVDFTDPQQVQIATDRTIGAAKWMSEQVQKGALELGHYEGPGGWV